MLQVEDALDDLVNQFADPFSFLRELVQNSLDAGSQEVEVAVTYEPNDGVAIVSVDDWGEGMDREIIDKKLTRLFSSGKDGDMTKIGKFGIGFVSVFAIEPDAVCVDTSREGETWRILFDDKREFKLVAMQQPVDGTKIRIYKTLPQDEFETFRTRARDTLVYWCKHTRGEIRFDGELVTQVFELPHAFCQVESNDGFSKLVVGHPGKHPPFFGFYNTGLTLIEGAKYRFGALSFKASSPHLEHTLTRDNVIQDAGYERVLASIEALADGPLRLEVYRRLESAVESGAAEPSLADVYSAAGWHYERGVLPEDASRAVARAPSGQLLTLDHLMAIPRERMVLVSSERTPLSDAAEQAGYTVAAAGTQGPCFDFLTKVAPEGVRVLPLTETLVVTLPAELDLAAGAWAALGQAVEALLEEHGTKLGAVQFRSFNYEGSAIRDRVAISQREVDELTPTAEISLVTRGLFAVRRVLTINADHPLVRRTADVARREPAMAAYILLKAFMLGSELDAEVEGGLAAATAQMRKRG